MGCSDLWKVLSKHGLIDSLKGGNRGDYERILHEIQGKILAVDVSVWLMEIKCVVGIRNHVRTEAAAFLKVLFEKLANMIRLGCTPVLVLEGEVDESKHELIERRYNRAYVKKKARNRFSHIERLAAALGIVTIRAPGEGEAMCAALDSLALVNGCITRDSDAFAFGAQTVYKTLILSSRVVKQNEIEVCRLGNARELFGICSGGMMAMRLLTVLSGGDYNIGGTQNVGGVKALATVQALLNDKLDDKDLVDSFWTELFKEPTSESKPPPMKSCTGCRTCGCPLRNRKARKEKHGALGCIGCGTQSVEEGGNGDGGCIPLQEGEHCQCPYCLWTVGNEGKREQLGKVLDNARRQSTNHTTLNNAFQTYDRQRTLALQSAKRFTDRLPSLKVTLMLQTTWGMYRVDFLRMYRPKVQELTELMEKHLEWGVDTTREKLLPLLLEWDAAHRYHSDTGPRLFGLPSAAVYQHRLPTVEFRVKRILRLGTRGRQLGNQHSEIVVEVERKEDVNPERVAFDREWLQSKADGGRWSLLKKLVDENYTDLIRQFKEKDKKAKGSTVDRRSRKITDFMKPASHQGQSSALRNDGTVSTDEKKGAMETPRKLQKKCGFEEELSDFDTRPVDDVFFSPGVTTRRRYTPRRESSRRRAAMENRFSSRPKDRMREDIRTFCSPKKKTPPDSVDRDEHGSTKKIGSVPRRFSDLSLSVLQDPVFESEKKGELVSEEEEEEEEQMQTTGLEGVDDEDVVVVHDEVVDLLTPRSTVRDKESVIDLLSETSFVQK